MRNNNLTTIVFGSAVTVIFIVVSRSTVWAYAPLQATKVFTPQSPYYEKADRNGKFTGQVNYRSAQRFKPMAWSFQTTPFIRSIASSPMVCSAGHYQLPYHDVHGGIAIDYLWHSTVSNNRFNKTYVMWGVCKFTVNVGGRIGQARLDFRFSYRVNHGPRTAMVDGEQHDEAPDGDAPSRDIDSTMASLDSSLAITFADLGATRSGRDPTIARAGRMQDDRIGAAVAAGAIRTGTSRPAMMVAARVELRLGSAASRSMPVVFAWLPSRAHESTQNRRYPDAEVRCESCASPGVTR